MTILKNKLIYLFALMCTVLIISCEEDSETDDDLQLSRMFRPIQFQAQVDGNNVRFYWTGIVDATYVVEVSQDSLLFTNNLQQFAVEDSTRLTVRGLMDETRYSARIKSVSRNSVTGDSGWQELTFVTE